ncbi:hypothetical protein [Changchengzhania lutea]|uniref:hypothetical protein n=1 Tax=Changchengzhania lutea TaxID=2049305 RepID=UPI00115EADC3|nr:hypothetical protein [Changchengzhania lutea]
MKVYSLLIIFLVSTACSKNNANNENCKFLLDLGVNETVNLSLPQYSQLDFISVPVYIPNAGNGGIIVTKTGTSSYVAFDAADPNHIFSSCSVLSIDGINGICGCDDKNEYNLFNGLPAKSGILPCSLRPYRVEKSGNTLLIFN